jgi:hypothetical protein
MPNPAPPLYTDGTSKPFVYICTTTAATSLSPISGSPPSAQETIAHNEPASRKVERDPFFYFLLFLTFPGAELPVSSQVSLLSSGCETHTHTLTPPLLCCNLIDLLPLIGGGPGQGWAPFHCVQWPRLWRLWPHVNFETLSTSLINNFGS